MLKKKLHIACIYQTKDILDPLVAQEKSTQLAAL